MSLSGALPCDDCLRRTWLLARLVGHIENQREQGRRLPLLLALPDDEVIAAVAGTDAGGVRAWWAAFDPDAARAALAAAGCFAVCRCDPRFPERLGPLPDAPAVLTGPRDTARHLDELAGAPAVAVVGTRRASAYAQEIARALGRGLSASGVTVVSGLALGVDSAAHEGALEAGGRTIAVLAGGPERARPASRRRIYAGIIERGAVVSELPPGTEPRKWCFPARNRVIAGLADLTVVVEGAERSGSLITAGFAEDLGREVAAVPGRVTDDRAAGSNGLLLAGAHLVRDAADVLDLLFGAGAGVRAAADPYATLPERLHPVLRSVREGRDGPALLGDAANLAALAELELLGCVRREPGGGWVALPSM